MMISVIFCCSHTHTNSFCQIVIEISPQGVQEFAASLDRSLTKEYTSWMYEINKQNQQIGGFIRRWDGLTFATVKGAGHMVPTDKPAQAFHLFSYFIKGKW